MKLIIVFLKKCKLRVLLGIILLVYIFFLLPRNWFDNPVCTVVYDKNGELLGARIASDYQWRFPRDSVISEKIEKCILGFEDEYFYFHPGFNPVSLSKALRSNIKKGKKIRGGSTITMQLCRLYRKNSKRTISEKLTEILIASRIELHYSKKEILGLYLSNAPFGGNIVGVEAAAWRYFGRSSKNLSWAEAATLAVLPNSPSLIHPGRNRQSLKLKRDKLLWKLRDKELISKEDYNLAILEEIPERPSNLPTDAIHVTNYFANQGTKVVYSTIDKKIQLNTQRIVNEYLKVLEINKIYNVSVIIADVKSNNIIAYIGNANNGKAINSPAVDIARAPRSTGSIIKPLLYASMINDGLILPSTLIPDIPTRISGFKPDNYDGTYFGAIPAKNALSRSLNVPIVRMLQTYGVEKFYNNLKKLGMTTLKFTPDHYGLTLVVGGAEGSLFDLTGIYSNLSRILVNYNLNQNYSLQDIKPLNLMHNISSSNKEINTPINAGSIYLMFDALLSVNRPEEEENWRNISSARKIGWKTGTSYGFRDAWAIGTTPEYVVGVWVGNANGEGRPGLTGIAAAAPLMFNIFSTLKINTWFSKPYDELTNVIVCKQSGFKAGRFCEETDTIYTALKGLETNLCPYHQLVHLSSGKKFRVSMNCLDTSQIVSVPWFILPPAQEWYFKQHNPFYKTLPPMQSNCSTDEIQSMEIVYPADVYKIFIPKELDGSKGKLVIEIAHRNPKASLFWHLDDVFLAETNFFHQLAITPNPGWHTLSVVDGFGNYLNKKFFVLE